MYTLWYIPPVTHPIHPVVYTTRYTPCTPCGIHRLGMVHPRDVRDNAAHRALILWEKQRECCPSSLRSLGETGRMLPVFNSVFGRETGRMLPVFNSILWEKQGECCPFIPPSLGEKKERMLTVHTPVFGRNRREWGAERSPFCAQNGE